MQARHTKDLNNIMNDLDEVRGTHGLKSAIEKGDRGGSSLKNNFMQALSMWSP